MKQLMAEFAVILKSPLAPQFIVFSHYRVDFWETLLAASIGGHLRRSRNSQNLAVEGF